MPRKTKSQRCALRNATGNVAQFCDVLQLAKSLSTLASSREIITENNCILPRGPTGVLNWAPANLVDIGFGEQKLGYFSSQVVTTISKHGKHISLQQPWKDGEVPSSQGEHFRQGATWSSLHRYPLAWLAACCLGLGRQNKNTKPDPSHVGVLQGEPI